MPLGIGAGGAAGIAFEVLAPPVQAAATTSTTGGTLPTASTYRYMVTAINALGETIASNEQTVTTGAGATNSNTVNWGTVAGATGYRVYRTTAGGGTGTELFLVALGVVLTYIDTGALTPSGALPSSNTALTSGTYAPPTKFFPFNSETVKYVQDTQWRRPIRMSAGIIGAVPGNAHVEGDMEMEALEDVVPYFLHCARATVVKSGTTNYSYVYTPSASAVPLRTFSLTIERIPGTTHGYTGCVVSSFKFGINNGMLTFTISIIGRNEANQTDLTPTWPTSVPFGAGQYSIEIPTGTAVLDTDTFEFTCDDQATPQYRLKSTDRGATFVNYGERNCTTHFERDFVDRTDYDAFKALTAQTITITGSKGANNSISALIPVAIKDTYEVALNGQGTLVRAVVQYQNVIDSTGKEYQLTVKTQESL